MQVNKSLKIQLSSNYFQVIKNLKIQLKNLIVDCNYLQVSKSLERLHAIFLFHKALHIESSSSPRVHFLVNLAQEF